MLLTFIPAFWVQTRSIHISCFARAEFGQIRTTEI